MDNLIKQTYWPEFQKHVLALSRVHLGTILNKRNKSYKLRLGGIEYDFSNNHFTTKTIGFFKKYTHNCNISAFIDKLFSAWHLNNSEDSPVLHMALRANDEGTFFLNGDDLHPLIKANKDCIKKIADDIRSDKFRCASGKKVKNIVHLGTGGSELGPRMLIKALSHLKKTHINIKFLSNLDPCELEDITNTFCPSETVVIIASKSFSTYETLTNAKQILSWLGDDAVSQQCFAITANALSATKLGISSQHILPLWSWVGGRFSIWSAISLVVAIAIGYENFNAFIKGGQLVDQHIKHSSTIDNIPLLMALFDILYTNLMSIPTRAIIPYSAGLEYFVDYIQQVMMESNGKSHSYCGKLINYQTSPIIWGGVGTNSQHSFHQLLMQGTHQIAIDLIYFKQTTSSFKQQHQLLVEQCLAQSKALAYGSNDVNNQSIYYVKGNQPQNVLAIESATPYNIGTLIALYEYRSMFYGALLNINSFDQHGVELGKKLVARKFSKKLIARSSSFNKTIKLKDNQPLNKLKLYK